MDLTKLPIPDTIPEDSADSFIVDIGTYIPLKNTLNVHHVLRRPQLSCRHKTRILFGLAGGNSGDVGKYSVLLALSGTGRT